MEKLNSKEMKQDMKLMELRIITPPNFTKSLCCNSLHCLSVELVFFLNQKRQVTLEIGSCSKLKVVFYFLSLEDANS